jgi:hypothetical protein
MMMFYVGPIVDVLLCKWFLLDVKTSKVMDEFQLQHGGKPNINTNGLQFVLTKSEKITYDVIKISQML